LAITLYRGTHLQRGIYGKRLSKRGGLIFAGKEELPPEKIITKDLNLKGATQDGAILFFGNEARYKPPIRTVSVEERNPQKQPEKEQEIKRTRVMKKWSLSISRSPFPGREGKRGSVQRKSHHNKSPAPPGKKTERTIVPGPKGRGKGKEIEEYIKGGAFTISSEKDTGIVT